MQFQVALRMLLQNHEDDNGVGQTPSSTGHSRATGEAAIEGSVGEIADRSVGERKAATTPSSTTGNTSIPIGRDPRRLFSLEFSCCR